MSAQIFFDQPIVWKPNESYIEHSRLKRFMNRHGIFTFDELMQRSISDIRWFWEAVFDDLHLEFYEPYSNVVDLSRGIPWPEWCVGAKLNIVHNCIDKWMGTPTENHIAIRWEDEASKTRTLTYGQLFREVNQMAEALRARGLSKGDVIGLYMPMIPEIVIAFLAIAKIGGIILPLFSGYGVSAIASRLVDANVKALLVTDGQFRRGKIINMKMITDEALNDIDSVRTVVVFPRTGQEIVMKPERDIWWHDFIAGHPYETHTEYTYAEDPIMILYTSGTTGRPKGAVHTHCGFPIKAAQDMAHGFDIQPFDTMYWMSDMGWMMGPWEVFGTLLLGASMLLYDGSPDYPDVDRVWALVERHHVTCLGVSPTFIRAIMTHGDDPVKRHDLSSLRILGSTGEPWNPDPWHWLFEIVGRSEIPIINYSGGTEISGGIFMGNVLLPLKPCAFSGPAPGMAVDIVDEHGNSIQGEVGELVLRQPWIGMTRGFWKDPERYLETYWSRWPDIWVHGDFAAVDHDGQYYILGRSDDTIKVAGKRVGPAEVESILVNHQAVVEAAIVGVPDNVKGQAIVAFVVLHKSFVSSETIRHDLVEWVAQSLGKSLAPKRVYFVADIPKTRNAKVMRRLIRAAYLDEPLGNLAALVNPESVDEIRGLRDKSSPSHD
ncbi:MAG TPA: AMP-binding protein [Oculatellaceae cyanobacterium]|nr:AMP-binding protein [Aggregatilineaceae bacterium]